jgi:CheY-like chemotaxis protein
VLVVDDDAVSRHLMSIVLANAGYAVLEARTGSEALSILAHVRVIAVLLDLHPPDLDGLGVIEAIRADPAMREISVLLVTSDNDPAQCVAGLTAGAADYDWQRVVRARFEQRNALGRALARVGDHAGADVTVTAMCAEVAAVEGRSGAGVVVFGERAATVIAATGLSDWGITTGEPLAASLPDKLMSRAREGPWLERPGFALAPTDGTWSSAPTLACAPLAGPGGCRGVLVLGIDTPSGWSTAEEMTDALGEAIDSAVTLNALLGWELERWGKRTAPDSRHRASDQPARLHSSLPTDRAPVGRRGRGPRGADPLP